MSQESKSKQRQEINNSCLCHFQLYLTAVFRIMELMIRARL
jgi:hypothetical protein